MCNISVAVVVSSYMLTKNARTASIAQLFADIAQLHERCRALRESANKESVEFERLSHVQGSLYCARLDSDGAESNKVWRHGFLLRTAPMCLFKHQLSNVEYAKSAFKFIRVV